MLWAIAGFAGILLVAIGAVTAIVWQLGRGDAGQEALPDHFPPQQDQ